MTSISPQSASWASISATVTGSKAAEPRPAAGPHDTVKLSQSAQVVTLYRSGQSVASISSAMGISKAMVNDYLGLIEEEAIQVSAGGGGGGAPQGTASSGSASSVSTSANSSASSTNSSVGAAPASAELETQTATTNEAAAPMQSLSVTA